MVRRNKQDSSDFYSKGEPLYIPHLSRRDVLKAIGFATLAGVSSIKYIDTIDKHIAHERWPADRAEVVAAIGSEDIPQGGEEWLVFGGFGQKYSINAAQELFNAIGRRQVVASVTYPNQGFAIDDIAQLTQHHIEERKMKAINIVGVSMGLPTALMALRTLQQQSTISKSPLPDIKYLAAYSSPADLHDAIDGDLAPWISTLSQRSHYEPGVIAKFLYSTTDGSGDFSRLLNVLNQKQWLGHIATSIEQTFNDCPPRLVLSQIQIMSSYNVEKQWQELRGLVSPYNTQFVYCAPSNDDRTVNNGTAIRKYKSALTNLAVPTTILDTGPSGHANTYASAAALGTLVAASV